MSVTDDPIDSWRRIATIAAPETLARASGAAPGEDLYALLADNLPVLCWMANADGFIFWYNRRWHDYCGSTPEAMEGWGWQTVHDPDRLPEVTERWRASIASGRPFEMTFPLRGADGSFRPFLTRIVPIHDDVGRVLRWFGVNIDIDAQMQAEAALRTSNQRLEAFAVERDTTLRQLGEGVIVTDSTGKIVFVNPAAERLHGVAKLGVEPDGYSTAYGLYTVEGEPHPLEELPLYRALHYRETVVEARWVIRRPDGSDVLAIGNARPMFADDGELLGAVLTIRDDTERHAAEVALANAVRQQELLIAELNHRVKNAFAVVKAIVLQSLGKTQVARDIRESIDGRLQAYANAHARLSQGHWDRADLATLAEEIFGHHVREGRVTIDGPAVILPARKALALSMAFYELMTNAIKHGALGPGEGRAELRWTRDQGEAPRLRLSWQERGGPAATKPERAGFGSVIIDRALTAEMQGAVAMTFAAEGFSWTLEAPVEAETDKELG